MNEGLATGCVSSCVIISIAEMITYSCGIAFDEHLCTHIFISITI